MGKDQSLQEVLVDSMEERMEEVVNKRGGKTGW